MLLLGSDASPLVGYVSLPKDWTKGKSYPVLVCADGYSSSLAVVSLEQLGFVRVGDLVGGFNGWVAAGLPTEPAPLRENGLTGMGRPVPARCAPTSHDPAV